MAQEHPFDTFCAAFGLKRHTTTKFWLRRATPDTESLVRVTLFKVDGLPESLTLTYLMHPNHEASRMMDDEDTGVWAIPQPNGGHKLLVMANRPDVLAKDWLELSLRTNHDWPWARDVYAQVGGSPRPDRAPFVVFEVMAQTA